MTFFIHKLLEHNEQVLGPLGLGDYVVAAVLPGLSEVHLRWITMSMTKNYEKMV